MLTIIYFRRSVTSALSQMGSDQISNHSSSDYSTQKNQKKTRQRQLVISDSESDVSDSSSDEQDDPNQSLKRFLSAYQLDEHFELLLKHQIDLDTLILLTDDDLKILNLPLGPYRRLANAIMERKNALANPGPIVDTRL